MTVFLVEFQGGLRRALHTELVLKPLILFSVGRTYPWGEIKASHIPLSTDVCVSPLSTDTKGKSPSIDFTVTAE